MTMHRNLTPRECEKLFGTLAKPQFLAYAQTGSSMSRTTTPYGVKLQRTDPNGQITAEWIGFYKTMTLAEMYASKVNVMLSQVSTTITTNKGENK